MQDSPRMRPRHCTVRNYLIIAIQDSLANYPRHILLRFISPLYIVRGLVGEERSQGLLRMALIVPCRLTPCLFTACWRYFLSSGKLYGPQYNLRTASWCCNKFTRIRRDKNCMLLLWHLLCKKGIAIKQLDADEKESLHNVITAHDRKWSLDIFGMFGLHILLFSLPGARYDLWGQLV